MPSTDPASPRRPRSQARRPVGRPRADQGPLVTRDAIVETAADHFTRKGYSGTYVRDIAESLGVSLAAVQHHMPKKIDLYRAVVDDVIIDRLLDVEPQLAQRTRHDPAGIDVAAMVARHVQRSLLRLGLPIAILTDFDDGHTERTDYLHTRLAPVMSATRTLLTAVIDDGQVRDIDIDAMIALLTIGVGAITTSAQPVHTVLGLDLDDPEALERISAGLIDIVLHGILTNRSDQTHAAS